MALQKKPEKRPDLPMQPDEDNSTCDAMVKTLLQQFKGWSMTVYQVADERQVTGGVSLALQGLEQLRHYETFCVLFFF